MIGRGRARAQICLGLQVSPGEVSLRGAKAACRLQPRGDGVAHVQAWRQARLSGFWLGRSIRIEEVILSFSSPPYFPPAFTPSLTQCFPCSLTPSLNDSLHLYLTHSLTHSLTTTVFRQASRA